MLYTCIYFLNIKLKFNKYFRQLRASFVCWLAMNENQQNNGKITNYFVYILRWSKWITDIMVAWVFVIQSYGNQKINPDIEKQI